MSVSRRGFGAVVGGALLGGWASRAAAHPERAAEAFRAGGIQVSFTGLCLLQYKKPNAGTLYPITTHFLKNAGHNPRILARLIDVDLAMSGDNYDVEVMPTGEQVGIWDIPKADITFDGLQPDTLDYSVAGSYECPRGGDWSSLYWLPDLREATGAQNVDRRSNVWGGSIAITHGSLSCEMPFNSTGANSKWRLNTDGMAYRAMSDRVTYSARSKDKAVTLKNGAKPVVTLKTRAGHTSACSIFSLPSKVTPGTMAPDLHHLKLFKDMLTSPVKEITPDRMDCISGPSPFAQVEPIYCPPGHFPEP